MGASDSGTLSISEYDLLRHGVAAGDCCLDRRMYCVLSDNPFKNERMESTADPRGLVILFFSFHGDPVCEMHSLYAAGVSDALSAGRMGIDKILELGEGLEKNLSSSGLFFCDWRIIYLIDNIYENNLWTGTFPG